MYGSDAKEFFLNRETGVRDSLFNRRIRSRQLKGCERVIEMCQHPYFNLPRQFCSYILATSYHETARRMHPVRETLARSDLQAIQRLDKAFERGQMKYVKKPYWRGGFFGRGEVQLTFERNYAKMSEIIYDSSYPFRNAHVITDDRFLVDDPALLINDAEISSFVMISGMMLGSFTGWSLSSYREKQNGEYVFHARGARRVVNPHDRDSYAKIESHYDKFERAFEGAK